MRVLVTGGAGYIGSRVVSKLLEEGLEVVVFDKLLFGGEGLLSVLDHPRLSFVAGDIRDHQSMDRTMVGVNAIVHLAALVGEPACNVDPDMSWEINYAATTALLRLATDRGIERIVFFSTCSNYGVSDPSSLATEETPLRPLSVYAESKIRAEHAVLEASSSSMATCVLRLGTICGLSPRMRFGLLVNDMARSAALGHTISVYAPDAWRPYLHIRDAGRAVVISLRAARSQVNGRVFNVVGENFQKKHLVEMARRHVPGVPVELTEAVPDLRSYRASSERIERELGYRPAYSIENAFAEVLSAVRLGMFLDPCRAIYEALPDRGLLRQVFEPV